MEPFEEADTPNNPGWRHSIRTHQQSTSINAPIFTPEALPATTLPIYPGLGHAHTHRNMLDCISLWFGFAIALTRKQMFFKSI